MMNWLVKWGVKKWLLDVVNKALAAYNVNIDRARAIVAAAVAKIEAVVASSSRSTRSSLTASSTRQRPTPSWKRRRSSRRS